MNQRISKLIKRVAQSKREEKEFKRLYVRLPHTIKCHARESLVLMYKWEVARRECREA